jgi:hypothetical protein
VFPLGSTTALKEGSFLRNIFGLIYLLSVIEQFAWNKSSLILKILKGNMQALQLFTRIIKMESICKSNEITKLCGLVEETKWSN